MDKLPLPLIFALRWLLSWGLFLFVLAGCATTHIEAPQSHLFSEMEASELQMPGALKSPARPQSQLVNGENENALMCFDAKGARQLIARDEIGKKNAGIANECAAGFDALQQSHNQLLQQAQLLEQQYNKTGEHWADAEAQLQDEERDNAVTLWLHRIAIVILLGVAL